jgi:hypothetical protein
MVKKLTPLFLSLSLALIGRLALAQETPPPSADAQSPAAEAPAASVSPPAASAGPVQAVPAWLPTTMASPSAAPQPAPAASSGRVSTKFDATFYGFIELDSIFDSTQSFTDLAGGASIQRPGTYANGHGRTTFAVRNSRLGFKLTGPETENLKTSGIFEMDFFGNQPQSSPLVVAPQSGGGSTGIKAASTGAPTVSEASYFTSPTFRIRHAALKLATPIVDILAGQYWSLFGWQSMFHPNTVEIQGVPGQIYARTPQIRLSHVFDAGPVGIEVAVAAGRPAQRDSEVPDGLGGLRFMVNDWKALHTAGATGTAVDPLSVGVSGIARRFKVPDFSDTPTISRKLNGWGVSVDALLPVIPAKSSKDGNALTLTGSFVYGRAIADLYTGFNGGAFTPTLPSGNPFTAQDVDNGLVVYDATGVMHAIYWRSFIVGAQYYLPMPARVWVSGNYSHMNSNNINALAGPGSSSSAPTKIFDKEDWADGNLFFAANDAVRFGLEYAWFRQTYLDGVKANDKRVQFSAFYVF